MGRLIPVCVPTWPKPGLGHVPFVEPSSVESSYPMGRPEPIDRESGTANGRVRQVERVMCGSEKACATAVLLGIPVKNAGNNFVEAEGGNAPLKLDHPLLVFRGSH
jgi:hypothetical protein